jgi:hypothetical protein
MIKLPLLFLATLGICLPSFYIFNLVLGSKLKFGQLVVLLLYAVCLTAVICASLAPVAFFFMICGSSYHFMVLLHVAIMTLAGLIGLGGMRGGLRFLSEKTGKIGTEKNLSVLVAPLCYRWRSNVMDFATLHWRTEHALPNFPTHRWQLLRCRP